MFSKTNLDVLQYKRQEAMDNAHVMSLEEFTMTMAQFGNYSEKDLRNFQRMSLCSALRTGDVNLNDANVQTLLNWSPAIVREFGLKRSVNGQWVTYYS